MYIYDVYSYARARAHTHTHTHTHTRHIRWGGRRGEGIRYCSSTVVSVYYLPNYLYMCPYTAYIILPTSDGADEEARAPATALLSNVPVRPHLYIQKRIRYKNILRYSRILFAEGVRERKRKRTRERDSTVAPHFFLKDAYVGSIRTHM